MFKQALAFLKKDFLIESSYKFSFLFDFFSILASVSVYFFIDKLFNRKMTGYLEEFGVNYFSYVLIGMAIFNYIGVGLGSFSSRIQSEQTQGTLEAILLTPAGIASILFSMALWNLIFSTIYMLIYIAIGIFYFHIDFSNVNMVSVSAILTLTITSFSSLGILSSSFIMVFKRGNPISWAINNLEGLICGVYFPVSVLPVWLQWIAKLLPITYTVRAIELAVYRNYSVMQLSKEITFLFAFSCLLLPLSFVSFKYALKKAKMEGSLTKY